MPKLKTAVCIRMAMEKGDISSKSLGERMKVVKSTVARWRKEGCDSMTDLETIAKHCGMSLDQMMGLAE